MGLTLYISNKGDMGVLVFTQVLLDMAEPFAIEEVCWMHWPGESLSIVVPPPLIIEKVGFECHHRWKGWGCSICNSVKAFEANFWLEKKSPLPFSRQWTNYKLTNRIEHTNLQTKIIEKTFKWIMECSTSLNESPNIPRTFAFLSCFWRNIRKE